MLSYFIIPDLLAKWPWARVLNPGLNELRKEANPWVQSFKLFEPSQFKKFKACDFCLLAALTAPLDSKDHLRSTCDILNFVFVFDEYTDLTNESEARQITASVMDAFRHYDDPSRCAKNPIAEMGRQFFERAVSTLGQDKQGMERFIVDFGDYVHSMIPEAGDRAHGRRKKVEEYLLLRRDTVGTKAVFSLSGLGLQIPNYVFDEPIMKSLIENGTDLVIMSNDMHSYALEYSRGQLHHNLIASIMYEHGLGVQEALEWLAKRASDTIDAFICNRELLPSWGEDIDSAVKEYLNRLGRWARGADAWSYESRRYYGTNGLKIQKSRRVAIKPCPSYLRREQVCALLESDCQQHWEEGAVGGAAVTARTEATIDAQT